MNPQLFVLTLGALGLSFALAQLGAVLALSIALGLVFGATFRPDDEKSEGQLPMSIPRAHSRSTVIDMAGHIGFYFLIGAVVGAGLQVLLPRLGLLNWMGEQGLLSTPILGWVGAPFYTCGGSAVPLARSLGQSGFSQGTLLAFLLAGPALRGTTLANLGCILPRRTLAGCLAVLFVASGLVGFGFDHLAGAV
jgi:uncharacterized membrane protein YraQ (UPF0718 family)